MGAHFAGGFASGYADTMRQLLPIVEQGRQQRDFLEQRKKESDLKLKLLDMETQKVEKELTKAAKLQEYLLRGVEQPAESASEFGMATGTAAPPSTFREPSNEDVLRVMPSHMQQQFIMSRMMQQPPAPKFMQGPNGAIVELPTQQGGTPRVALPGEPPARGPKFMSGPGGAIVELPDEAGGTPRVALPGVDPKASEPLTPEGKRIADAASLFGAGSPQHKAMMEAFGKQPEGAEPVKLSDVAGLRKEFTSRSTEFITQRDAYARIKAVGAAPSAAGDLALIFSYMKLLDPTSAVRETEFANAQNAAGIPDRVRAMWNRALTGERLPPEQRADFINQTNVIFGAALARHAQTEEQYRQQASLIGVDPKQVVVDFIGDLRGKPTNAPAAGPAIPAGFKRVP